MTTTVKIEVHCSEDREVLVQRWNKNTEQEYILQNGDSKELYVYKEGDDLGIGGEYKICVFERDKNPNPNQLELF